MHREIGWWLEHRSVERIILVVADGEIVWDQAIRDFDQQLSSALPPILRGAFEEEPHWVDAASLAEGEEPTDREVEMAIADIAAPIRGIPKEQLVAAAEREHRRTMRWVRGTILGLLLLLAAAVVAGVIAFEQRSTARNEAKVAVSRQLASTSEALAGSNLDAAMLLSVQAFRTDDNPQTRAALFNADTSSPALVGFLQTEHPVSQVAGSRDGHHYVAGLKDGEVLAFSGIGAKPERLFQLDHAITSLAIDAHGTAVAASDGHEATLWRAGKRPEPLPIPSGERAAHLVGLSPSGRTLVYGSGKSQYGGNEEIAVAPTDDLGKAVFHAGGNAATGIDLPSGSRVLLVSTGSWEWKQFSSWSGIGSTIGVGARDLSLATSADGRFITETNGASPVPVWSTSRRYGLDPQPSGNVEAPLPTQKLLALSPDGSRMAIVSPGEIYDAAVRSTGAAGERQVEEEEVSLGAGAVSLTGQDAELVSFANDRQLISAQGDEVAIWDADQVDRLEHTQTLHLVPGCELCGPPRISISPDGARAAVINGSGAAGFVENLDGDRRLEEIPPVGFEDARTYGSPIWLEGGARVAFPVWAAAGNPYASLPPPDKIPADMKFWPAGEGAEYPLLDAADGAGKDEAFLMDDEGGFYLRRSDDGALIRSSPPTYGPEEEGDGSARSTPPASSLPSPMKGRSRSKNCRAGASSTGSVSVGSRPSCSQATTC